MDGYQQNLIPVNRIIILFYRTRKTNYLKYAFSEKVW